MKKNGQETCREAYSTFTVAAAISDKFWLCPTLDKKNTLICHEMYPKRFDIFCC